MQVKRDTDVSRWPRCLGMVQTKRSMYNVCLCVPVCTCGWVCSLGGGALKLYPEPKCPEAQAKGDSASKAISLGKQTRP